MNENMKKVKKEIPNVEQVVCAIAEIGNGKGEQNTEKSRFAKFAKKDEPEKFSSRKIVSK